MKSPKYVDFSKDKSGNGLADQSLARQPTRFADSLALGKVGLISNEYI
jgi:hypothetical protein